MCVCVCVCVCVCACACVCACVCVCVCRGGADCKVLYLCVFACKHAAFDILSHFVIIPLILLL